MHATASSALPYSAGRQKTVLRFIILCLLYAGGAALVSPDLYTRNLLQFTLAFVPSVCLLAGIGLYVLALHRQPAAPLNYMTMLIRARSASLALITIGMCIFMAAFWTLKYHMPSIVPFFADATLADIDAALHFGDPWKWLHAITPPGLMPVLVFLYFPVWVSTLTGGICIAALHHDHRMRLQYMIALVATYVVAGNILAAGMSSVGPIFYDRFIEGSRFAGLTEALRLHPASHYIFFFADRLHAAYMSSAEDILAGISAMPSIHVAVATLNAFFLSTLGKWWGRLGWTFLGIILFGSVYFGWHYALDGYVSFVFVWLIWRTAGAIAYEED